MSGHERLKVPMCGVMEEELRLLVKTDANREAGHDENAPVASERRERVISNQSFW